MGGEPSLAGTPGHADNPGELISKKVWQFPDEASQVGFKNIVFLGKTCVEYINTSDNLSDSLATGSHESLTGLIPTAVSIVSIPYARIDRIMARVNSPGIEQTLFIEGDNKIICINTTLYVNVLYNNIKSLLGDKFDETIKLEKPGKSAFGLVLFVGFIIQLLILVLAYIVQKSWGLTPLPDSDPVAVCAIVIAGLGALWLFRRGMPKWGMLFLLLMMSELILMCHTYIPIIACVSSSLLTWYVVLRLRIAPNKILMFVRDKT